METLSDTSKYALLFIAAIAALHEIYLKWQEKRGKRAQNDAKHIKFQLTLILCVLIISTLSIGIDRHIDGQNARDAQNKFQFEIKEIQTNIDLASDSLQKLKLQTDYEQTILGRVESLVSRFQSIQAVVSFEFSAVGSSAKGFYEGNAIYLNSRRQHHETFSQAIVGYGYNGVPFQFYYPLTITSEGSNQVVTFAQDQLENMLLTSSDEVANFIKMFRSPPAYLFLSKNDLMTNSNPMNRFSASGMWIGDPKIEYLYPADELRVTSTIDFQIQNWRQSTTMSSLPDLSRAFVVLMLLSEDQTNKHHFYSHGITRSVQPLSLTLFINSIPIEASNLQFDTNSCTVYGMLPSQDQFIPVNTSSTGSKSSPGR